MPSTKITAKNLYILLVINFFVNFIPNDYYGVIFAFCINVAALIFLVDRDRGVLEDAGLTPPNLWWCLLMPVYVWKRCTVIGKGRWFWVLWIVLSVLVLTAGNMIQNSQPSGYTTDSTASTNDGSQQWDNRNQASGRY